jgi:pyruvate formate lyase activating enzyme
VSEPPADASGVIFDLQRFSVHDGPGIRTLVFCKGCPLACRWCANPESQRFEPELLFDPATCVACGGCVEACPQGAVLREADRPGYDRERCVVCGRCVEACHAEARTIAGRRVTAADVALEVLKDAPFFANSGGGVTLGGGEPLSQLDFARALLARCRAAGLHTAVETCGYLPWELLAAVLPVTDLFLYDLKHLDAARHAAETGGGVALILENLGRLAATGAAVIVRVPVVPGFNDDPETIRAIAERAAALGIRELHLLPYHRLGQNKYRLLGRRYDFARLEPPSPQALEALCRAAAGAGLAVRVGG